MKKKLITLSGLVLSLAPVAAFAAQTGGYRSCTGISTTGTLDYMICKIGDLVALITPILIGLAVIYFIWGIISYVIADDEEAKTAGRNRIIYGIIGLTVIVAVWGLVKVLTSTFGISDTVQQISYPTTPY